MELLKLDDEPSSHLDQVFDYHHDAMSSVSLYYLCGIRTEDFLAKSVKESMCHLSSPHTNIIPQE